MVAKKKAASSTSSATSASATPRSNAGAKARGEAMKEMIERYPEVWSELLAEHREKLGLPADAGRQTRLQKFVAKMRAAGVETEEIEAALIEAGFTKAKV